MLDLGGEHGAERLEEARDGGSSGHELFSSIGGLAVREDGGGLDQELLRLVDGGQPIISLKRFEGLKSSLNEVSKVIGGFVAVGVGCGGVSLECLSELRNVGLVLMESTLDSSLRTGS